MLENAWALIVGIAGYIHVHPLPVVVENDARAVYGVLTDPTQGAYLPEHVELLLGDDATAAALREGFSSLASSTDPDSVVFVYYSGHGARRIDGASPTTYLLPVDVNPMMTTPTEEAALSGDELKGLVDAIPARKLMMVLDCCHAAGLARAKTADPVLDLAMGFHDAELARLGAGVGRAVLSSSRADEESWVVPDAKNSVFTQHLVAGINGGVPSDDGLVRVFDLFEYVQTCTVRDQPNQHPVFRADLEANFPVAMRKAGERNAPPIDADGFEYDAYVSYVDTNADTAWVWEFLLPRLDESGFRIAVSGDVEQPGVSRVVNLERGITRARRTIVVLSDTYLADYVAGLQNELAQTIGVDEGTYRLLPLQFGPITTEIPMRMNMLTRLDFSDSRRSNRNLERLVEALRSPLPQR